jgi:O-antigen biosynthesis protein
MQKDKKEPNWPKITVVTPNRNSGDTLRETIESIATQNYPNLEYIVVDGNSTDGSLQIIQDYAEQIDGFLQGKDRNMYDAIAKGFDIATGDILAWLNSDDLYEPGILRRVGKIFSEHPDWDVVYFDGTILKQGWRIPNRPQKIVGYPELLAGHILYQDDVFFTRRAYAAVGGIDRFRFKVAGDYDLWLRLSARFDLHYQPQTASCCRLRDGQLSGDWGAYLKEMELARLLARQANPPGPVFRTWLGVQWRRARSHSLNARRRFTYQLRDENLVWPEVRGLLSPPLSQCKCPICAESPRQMLFSSTDPWTAGLDVWQFYRCTACNVSFQFPMPTEPPETASGETSGDSPTPYRLFRRSSILNGNSLYLRLSKWYALFRTQDSETPRIREPRDAAVLVIGPAEACDSVRAQGYQSVSCNPFTDEPWRAIVLDRTLQAQPEPLRFLRMLRAQLQDRGHVYISTPNLDSIWLKYYGPVWSQWHPAVNRVILSPRSLRRLAARAGFRIKWMRSKTPPARILSSDEVALRGLGDSGPLSIHTDDPRRHPAEGASVASAIRWDWRLRGDCLQACLVRSRGDSN